MFHSIIGTPAGVLRINSDGVAIVRISWTRPSGTDPVENPDRICRHAADELAAYFSGSLTEFSVPTILIGSQPQRAVWNHIRRIGFGKVMTYGAIADKTGIDARTVGIACGQNPVPIIVPCHRVVGTDGTLTGYSGGQGIATKRFLLDHEAGQGSLF